MEKTVMFSMLIASATLLAGFYLYIRFKERHALIEKGLDPSLTNIYSRKNNYSNAFLYVGILLLGIAMGILTGIMVARLMNSPGETRELIIISLIVWVGISCILCYYLSRSTHRE